MESNMACSGSNEKPTSSTTPKNKNIDKPSLNPLLASTMPVAPSGLDLDSKLEQELINHGIVPNEELLTNWNNGIGALDFLVQHCLKVISSLKEIQTNTKFEVSGKHFVVGSHMLGVANKGTELDVLVIAPNHIEQKLFFQALIYIMQRLDGIPYLTENEERHVPTLTIRLKGVLFNVNFVRLSLTKIPDEFDPAISEGLFMPECVRALNVYLAGKKIVSLVPNWDTFRLALRAIKLWARLNGVYGRAFGYLGGLSWAVLVARMCQEFPNDSAASIVNKVFQTFSKWSWPQYVALNPDSQHDNESPKILSSDKDCMPILNPAHPHENTNHVCPLSCKDITVEELKKGASITKEIVLGQASWNKLFQLQEFFGNYGHYIVVKISSDIQLDLLKCKKFAENGLIHSSRALQQRFPDLKQVRLWPHAYKNENPENGHLSYSWFFGVEAGSKDGKLFHTDFKNFIVDNYKELWVKKVKEVTSAGHETAVITDYVEKESLWRYISLPERASLPKTEAEMVVTNGLKI